MTEPERKQRSISRRDWIVIAVLLLLAIGALFPIFNSVLIWDGGVTRTISVRVCDEEGLPVAGAAVMYLSRDDKKIRTYFENEQDFAKLQNEQHRYFVSDQNGMGALILSFPAGGRSGVFGKKGNFRIVGEVVVAHTHYVTFQAQLANLVQGSRLPISRELLDFSVFLSRADESNLSRGKGVVDESQSKD